jgi:hypothetical protein
MDWDQIYLSLTESDRQEMTYLLLRRVGRPHRMRVRDLRPIHLLFPATFAQIGVLVWAVQSATMFFERLMIGYLVVVIMAILPSIYAKANIRVRPA